MKAKPSQAESEQFYLQSVFFIIGLGNSGQHYSLTRHNAGFLIVDRLFDLYGTGKWIQKPSYLIGQCSIPKNDGTTHTIKLVKPMVGMNNSGAILKELGFIPSKGLLVCYDELEKPFGSSMIRFSGSHRGHNGVRSIIQHYGPLFWQLRFGIGRPTDKADVGNYVLSPFTDEERLVIDQKITAALHIFLKNQYA